MTLSMHIVSALTMVKRLHFTAHARYQSYIKPRARFVILPIVVGCEKFFRLLDLLRGFWINIKGGINYGGFGTVLDIFQHYEAHLKLGLNQHDADEIRRTLEVSSFAARENEDAQKGAEQLSKVATKPDTSTSAA